MPKPDTGVGAPDLASLVAAAARQPAPVYLFIGEPFQTEAAARRLIDVVVPIERRSFNLETYDGRTAAIGPILDSLRTPGMFPGTKLIWVREPALFLSGEKRSDLTDALFAAWREDRPAEAAEKLLFLAALAGWTQEQFTAADWVALSAAEVSAVFGRVLDGREREALDAVRAHCLENNLTVNAQRDDSGLLEAFLAAGVPPNSVLVFTAAAVDRRKRIVKAIHERGTVLEFTLARERSGALSAESVGQVIRQIMSGRGKRLTPAAQRLIEQQAGTDPAPLASELEKLCLYVGERATIAEEDVRACMRDLAGSWIFDFTKALAQRQAATALCLLRALYAQGEHPVRLLALIARELRLLLLARDCLTDTLAGVWSPGTPFAVFRDRLWPRLSEVQRDAFGGVHPYVVYLALQNASRTSTPALQRGLLRLHELDIKFKSGAGDPRLLLEAFVLELCRPGVESGRSQAESGTVSACGNTPRDRP